LSYKDAVLGDAPVIPDRGSYGLPDLKHGPHFAKAIEDLLSPSSVIWWARSSAWT